MKTHTFIFIICAVSALAFFGCAKKQAVSKTEAVPFESAETQSEPAANAAVAQEAQIAKDGFDAWSDEEACAFPEEYSKSGALFARMTQAVYFPPKSPRFT